MVVMLQAQLKLESHTIQNKLNIEIKSAGENNPKSYVIYDEKGSLLLVKKLTSISDFLKESVDLSLLPTGNYILQLNSEKGAASKKFIKN